MLVVKALEEVYTGIFFYLTVGIVGDFSGRFFNPIESGPRSKNPDGKPRKKQHICHIPNCNKVYGKTSHLRAHLRWHSGERPFVCSWLFCGKRLL